MFIDARELASGTLLKSDVCIVGSGPAGLTLAHRLGEQGLSVTVLESGGLGPEPEAQELARGQVVGEPYWALDGARLRAFGGTSGLWTGWCRPLDPNDLAARPGLMIEGWPLTFAELLPYYKQAQGYLDLGEFDYSAEPWCERVDASLLPLEETAAQTLLWQLSTPTRFGEKYQPWAEESAGVRVYLHATVLGLERTGNGRRVGRALVARPDGEKLTVESRLFVLATGGIDNARLLLASPTGQGGGLANDSGLVGRYFLEHLHSTVGILLCGSDPRSLRLYERLCAVPEGAPPAVRATLGIRPEVRTEHRLLNASIGLEPMLRPPPYKPVQEVATRALARELQGLDARQSFELSLRAEQAPTPESRVLLSEDRDRLGARRATLDWRHDDLTLTSIRRTVELLAEALGQAGVGRVYSLVHADTVQAGSWPEIWGGHHHLGTTRMHDDPRRGVVNRDCRAHSIENLYLAGSSVFPTGGAANPTLTIVALSVRLAGTLLEQA